MSALQVYQDNVGHTHETAVQAVYDSGYADGQAAGGVSSVPYPDLSDQLAAAQSNIATLTAQVAALLDQVAALEAEITPPVAPPAAPPAA